VTGRASKKTTEAIRDMIDHRLKSISASATLSLPPGSHLDEDTISAFVEGRLGAAESKPVLSHLTTCGSCRRVSAQLVRLENQIDADTEPENAPEEPGRLQAFLANLQSLVPAGEDVVFAYQNPQSPEPVEKSAAPESDKEESTDKSA
jgi:anti-sigma factor RsiW